MKRAIICEGKTDAILIGYFLINRFGWKYIKRNVLVLPFDKKNEELNWYEHPDKPGQELVIWGVGGIDKISAKLGHIIERTKNERTSSDRFGRIVLFFDGDDRGIDKCKALVKKWMTEDNELDVAGDLKLGQWLNAKVELSNKSLAEDHNLLMLPIVLPPDGKGNLEIFLMDAIRGGPEHDEQLVDKAKEFIDGLPDEPYLGKKRYRPKACLGSILSVISPDWVFSTLNDRLTRITWEEIESVEAVYGNLSEL